MAAAVITREAFNGRLGSISEKNNLRGTIRDYAEQQDALVQRLRGQIDPLTTQVGQLEARVQVLEPLEAVVQALEAQFPKASAADARSLQERITALDGVALQAQLNAIAALPEIQGALGDTTLAKVQAVVAQVEQLPELARQLTQVQAVVQALETQFPKAGDADARPLQERIMAAEGPALQARLQAIASLQQIQAAAGDTTLAKVQAVIDQAAQLPALQGRAAVLDAILAISPGDEAQLANRIRAMDPEQLQAIADLPQIQAAAGDTTLEKVQTIIAQKMQLEMEKPGLIRKAQILKEVKQLFSTNMAYAQVVEQVRTMQGRVQVLNAVKAEYHVDADADLLGALQERAAAANRELAAKNRELAEEQSFTGTLWRVVSGIAHGILNLLGFFFVSIPISVVDTLRYFGGVVVR